MFSQVQCNLRFRMECYHSIETAADKVATAFNKYSWVYVMWLDDIRFSYIFTENFLQIQKKYFQHKQSPDWMEVAKESESLDDFISYTILSNALFNMTFLRTVYATDKHIYFGKARIRYASSNHQIVLIGSQSYSFLSCYGIRKENSYKVFTDPFNNMILTSFYKNIFTVEVILPYKRSPPWVHIYDLQDEGFQFFIPVKPDVKQFYDWYANGTPIDTFFSFEFSADTVFAAEYKGDFPRFLGYKRFAKTILASDPETGRGASSGDANMTRIWRDLHYKWPSHVYPNLSRCADKLAYLDKKENIKDIIPFLNDNSDGIFFMEGEDDDFLLTHYAIQIDQTPRRNFVLDRVKFLMVSGIYKWWEEWFSRTRPKKLFQYYANWTAPKVRALEKLDFTSRVATTLKIWGICCGFCAVSNPEFKMECYQDLEDAAGKVGLAFNKYSWIYREVILPFKRSPAWTHIYALHDQGFKYFLPLPSDVKLTDNWYTNGTSADTPFTFELFIDALLAANYAGDFPRLLGYKRFAKAILAGNRANYLRQSSGEENMTNNWRHLHYMKPYHVYPNLSRCGDKVAYLDKKKNIKDIIPYLNDNVDGVVFIKGADDDFLLTWYGIQIRPTPRRNFVLDRVKFLMVSGIYKRWEEWFSRTRPKKLFPYYANWTRPKIMALEKLDFTSRVVTTLKIWGICCVFCVLVGMAEICYEQVRYLRRVIQYALLIIEENG
ncbi:hypothetical protein Fcan01_28306 [Folsomia candida]|uniref:Uncharacterized protein n=1 Tax=Folsomia candida TaxID=158441 RepID=A0A226CTX4_FOLCA|nr:hypothetical protein Fcan01_28306 [Folsomia candida]